MERKINNWRNRKGRMNESVWVHEGIKLFRELLVEDRNNTEYKMELAKLLMIRGKDKKLNELNLDKAERLFYEVLQLDENNHEVYYRLGHVYFEKWKFEKSIDFFNQALKYTLSPIQLFRTYATMAEAYYYLECFSEAKTCFNKAKEADEERNFTSELVKLKELITEDGHVKGLLHDDDGIAVPVSSEQIEDIILEYEDEELTLDMLHHHPSLSGPNDKVRLENREAQVLKYLYSNKNRPVSKVELMDEIWKRAISLKTIEANISNIRKKLEQCTGVDKNEAILTVRGEGYRWAMPMPMKIMEEII